MFYLPVRTCQGLKSDEQGTMTEKERVHHNSSIVLLWLNSLECAFFATVFRFVVAAKSKYEVRSLRKVRKCSLQKEVYIYSELITEN